MQEEQQQEKKGFIHKQVSIADIGTGVKTSVNFALDVSPRKVFMGLTWPVRAAGGRLKASWEQRRLARQIAAEALAKPAGGIPEG